MAALAASIMGLQIGVSRRYTLSAAAGSLPEVVVGRTIWRPIGVVDHGRLRGPLRGHYAVQWLARAACALVPPQLDDNHTNFGWDDAVGGFTTHPLKGDVRLGLKLVDLALGIRHPAGLSLSPA
jgi:hypothetical protein